MTDSFEDVVVTGLGATTPLGGDVDSFWTGLLEGRSGVVALTDDWAADLPVRIAARMAVDPADVLARVQARRLDRSEQGAIVAARQAWADAGFEGRAEDNGLDPTRVNPELVDLAPLTPDEQNVLRGLVGQHLAETGSSVADKLLADWPAAVERFTAVVPRDYKRVMELIRTAEAAGRNVDEAVMGVKGA